MADDDADSEGLVRSLLTAGYRLLASVEQDQAGRLATVRLACPIGDGDVVVDLLFASSGIEAEIAQAADVTEIVPGMFFTFWSGDREELPSKGFGSWPGERIHCLGPGCQRYGVPRSLLARVLLGT